MQKLSPSQIPFTTTDAVLAFCLYLVGVPFQNPKRPLRNEYDIEILKKLGYRGEVDLLQAGRESLAAGKRGRIRYIFQNVPQLRSLLKIFSTQEKEIAAPDSKVDAAKWQADLMEKVAKGEMKPQEALLRLNCVSLKTYVQFRNIWKELPGFVQIDKPGVPKHFDTQVTVQGKGGRQTIPAKGVEYPGFTEVSTNASDKTLKKLGLI